MSRKTTSFVANSEIFTTDSDPDTPLLYILRNELGLKAAKFGCGQGLCGACLVLVDGRPVLSCDTPLWAVLDKSVLTLEGLASPGGEPHALQKAFIECQALQCGYCTPGILMRAAALLAENTKPSREEICKALERHLCRCGAHNRVIAAIQQAAERQLEGKYDAA